MGSEVVVWFLAAISACKYNHLWLIVLTFLSNFEHLSCALSSVERI